MPKWPAVSRRRRAGGPSEALMIVAFSGVDVLVLFLCHKEWRLDNFGAFYAWATRGIRSPYCLLNTG